MAFKKPKTDKDVYIGVFDIDGIKKAFKQRDQIRVRKKLKKVSKHAFNKLTTLNMMQLGKTKDFKRKKTLTELTKKVAKTSDKVEQVTTTEETKTEPESAVKS